MEEIPDVAATDLPNPVCSGFLNKKRPSKKLLSVKYQKRWCVIHEGIFYYYDGQLDRKQKGAFDLTGYKFFHLVGAENSFAFVKKGNRSFEFIAPTKKDFAKWEEAMRILNREDSKHTDRDEKKVKSKKRPRLPKGRAIPEIPEERPAAKVVNVPKRPPPPVPPSSADEDIDEDDFYMDPNEINDGSDQRPSTPVHKTGRRTSPPYQVEQRPSTPKNGPRRPSPPHQAVNTKDSDGYEKVEERIQSDVINKTPAVADPLSDPFYSLAQRMPLPPERSESESDDYEEVLDDVLDDNSEEVTEIKQDITPIYSVVQKKKPSGNIPPPRPPNLRTQRSQGSQQTSSEVDDDPEIDYCDVSEINTNPKKIISSSKSTPNPTIAHLLSSSSTRKKQKSIDDNDEDIDNGYAEFIADTKTDPDISDDVESDESDIYLDYGDEMDEMESSLDCESVNKISATLTRSNVRSDSEGKDSKIESDEEDPAEMYEDVDDGLGLSKIPPKPVRGILSPTKSKSDSEKSFDVQDDDNESNVTSSNGNSKSIEVPHMFNPLLQEMKKKMNIKEPSGKKVLQTKNSKEEPADQGKSKDPIYENISKKDRTEIIRKNSNPPGDENTKQSSTSASGEEIVDSGSDGEELYENF